MLRAAKATRRRKVANTIADVANICSLRCALLSDSCDASKRRAHRTALAANASMIATRAALSPRDWAARETKPYLVLRVIAPSRTIAALQLPWETNAAA